MAEEDNIWHSAKSRLSNGSLSNGGTSKLAKNDKRSTESNISTILDDLLNIEFIRELATKQVSVNRLTLIKLKKTSSTEKDVNAELMQLLSLIAFDNKRPNSSKPIIDIDSMKQSPICEKVIDLDNELENMMAKLTNICNHICLEDDELIFKARELNDSFRKILLGLIGIDQSNTADTNPAASHNQIPFTNSARYSFAMEASDENAMHFPAEQDFLEDLEPNFEVLKLTEVEFSQYKYLDPRRKEIRGNLRYEMCHSPRGPCLILNYAKYSDGDRRRGSELDVRCAARLFDQLGFRVRVENNLSLPKTIYVLTEIIHELKALRYLDGFVLIILGHGSDDFVYTSDCLKLNLEQDVLDQFESIIPEKPKLFLFQCCRGERQNLTYHLTHQSDHESKSQDASTTSNGSGVQKSPRAYFSSPVSWIGNIGKKWYRKKRERDDTGFRTDAILFTREPMRSDMFIWYSTQPSFVSLRFPKLGGVFLQSVAAVLSKGAWCYDLGKLALLVNGVIIRKLRKWQQKIQRDKDDDSLSDPPMFQSPYTSNHLTKLLYFNPGYVNYC
ncbi:hypothetical protein ACOME3_006914 [Neoechinorhynchus agilis]